MALGLTRYLLDEIVRKATGVYNVKSYEALGDGVSDDSIGLRAAVAAARQAGGGVVFLPAGTYLLNLAPHPVDGALNCGLAIGSGVTLRGAGRGATTIKLASNQTVGGAVLMNYSVAGGADENIVFEDFTIDGNNVNQTQIHHGIELFRAGRCSHTRLRAKNLRGTAISGASENFFYEASLSGDISYVDCIAQGTAGSTATGFSADNSTNVSYTGCRALGMSVSNGFTHNASRSVHYTNCEATLCGNHGFNSEVSTDVSYSSCVSGGQAVTSASTPYPYTTGQSLGNTGNGFNISGSSRVTLVGCLAAKCATGLFVGSAAGPVHSNGSSYCDNLFGVSSNDATSGGNLRCQGTVLSGNATSPVAATQVGNFTGLGFISAPPAVAASTVAVTNQTGFDCMVLLFGGTVSNVAITGAGVINQTTGWYRIVAGGTIAVTYSVAPSWYWYAE